MLGNWNYYLRDVKRPCSCINLLFSLCSVLSFCRSWLSLLCASDNMPHVSLFLCRLDPGYTPPHNGHHHLWTAGCRHLSSMHLRPLQRCARTTTCMRTRDSTRRGIPDLTGAYRTPHPPTPSFLIRYGLVSSLYVYSH